MNEALHPALAMAAGLLLGAIFFGGLWWTVRHGMRGERPALWFVGSLLLRMGVTASGFYFVGREHWQQLVMCLIGFIVARLAVSWLTRLPADTRLVETEAGHAP